MNALPFLDGLDDDLKRSVLGQLRDQWTHSSTAIEGNTLSLAETHFVLSEGLTVKGKPLKDHSEGCAVVFCIGRLHNVSRTGNL